MPRRVEIPTITLPEEPFYGITQGLPGSGKSSAVRTALASNIIRFGPEQGVNVVEVNRDDIRKELGAKFGRREPEVRKIRDNRIEQALAAGKSVICSDTNLIPKTVESHRQRAAAHRLPFHIFDFMSIPVGQCIEQDLKRLDSVGKDVIERLYYQYWSFQPKPNNDGFDSAILVDIDGTLAHTDIPFPQAYERDYRLDSLDVAVISVVEAMSSAGQRVILLSGRSEAKEDATYEWLDDHNVSYDELYMRPEGTDAIPDFEIKKQLYMQYVQGRHKILFVLDDRPSVVRMWRAELGLKVLHVAPNIEF